MATKSECPPGCHDSVQFGGVRRCLPGEELLRHHSGVLAFHSKRENGPLRGDPRPLRPIRVRAAYENPDSHQLRWLRAGARPQSAAAAVACDGDEPQHKGGWLRDCDA